MKKEGPRTTFSLRTSRTNPTIINRWTTLASRQISGLLKETKKTENWKKIWMNMRLW
jgi:hypothetical protein